MGFFEALAYVVLWYLGYVNTGYDWFLALFLLAISFNVTCNCGPWDMCGDKDWKNFGSKFTKLFSEDKKPARKPRKKRKK